MVDNIAIIRQIQKSLKKKKQVRGIKTDRDMYTKVEEIINEIRDNCGVEVQDEKICEDCGEVFGSKFKEFDKWTLFYDQKNRIG